MWVKGGLSTGGIIKENERFIMDLLGGSPTIDGTDFDMVSIRDLRIRCFIGVYESEREYRQDLDVDIDLFLDITQAAREGSLDKSVDYAQLSQALSFILENAHFELLETAADLICHFILKGYQAFSPSVDIKAVTVRLKKPKALPGFAYPAMTLHRKAEDPRLCFGPLESKAGLQVVYGSNSHLLSVLDVPPLASLSFHHGVNTDVVILKELGGEEITLSQANGERIEVKNNRADLARWLVLQKVSRSSKGSDFRFDFDFL